MVNQSVGKKKDCVCVCGGGEVGDGGTVREQDI